MTLLIRPLQPALNSLTGLSSRLMVSHHENNCAGAVKRANAIGQQLAQLDWASASNFTINGLKREELVALNSAVLHELYFGALGAAGELGSNGLSMALERDFGSVQRSTALALRARGIDARYLVVGIEAWREAGLPMQAIEATGA